MKVLVTGGAGFIGSHLVDEYIRLGHEVVIIDNFITGKRENVNPKAKLYDTDITSKFSMNRIFNIEKPDLVNHHAAQKSVTNSILDPAYDAAINILGTINLLKASADCGVKCFIAASSGGALCGDAAIIPTAEDQISYILTPYAASKLAMEQYLRYFYCNSDMRCYCLRYANVYGPRQDALGEGGVISKFLYNAMNLIPSVIYADRNMLFGNVRDYVYIDDVVRANIEVTNSMPNTYNIGTGVGTTTADVYRNVCFVTGCTQFANVEPIKKGDVRKSVLNCDSALNSFGWEYTVRLEEGIRRTHEHMKVHEELRQAKTLEQTSMPETSCGENDGK